jgi:hypothetical protein
MQAVRPGLFAIAHSGVRLRTICANQTCPWAGQGPASIASR